MGFTFNGISSQSMGLATRMASENRMPDFTNHTVTVPGREGVFDFGETAGERKIAISCFIPPGKSDADFLSKKDEIIAWLNPDAGICPLTLDKEPGRIYMARLESGFSFDKAVRNSCTFDLAFFCPDPYSYAGSDETYQITETGTSTVTRMLGNIDSCPVYSFSANLPAGKKPEIETNGRTLEIIGKLTENEVLVIDSALITAQVTDQNGNLLRNGLPHLKRLDFPRLKVGANTVVIEADSVSNVVEKTLNTQDFFTGQIPSSWGNDGLWRFNDNAPDVDTCLADSSGKGRKLYINNWSGTTATMKKDGHLGNYFKMNLNDPGTEKSYLKLTNDGTLFSNIGAALAAGGWFCPTTYSVGNTYCPILNTRGGPGNPIIYFSLFSGEPRFMFYNASGTLIYDNTFNPGFALLNGGWYFMSCLIRPESREVSLFVGDRSSGAIWTKEDVLNGDLNRSCTADLLWGTHAGTYWYAGGFDEWFLDCDSNLTPSDVISWFKKSLSANGADAASDADGLQTENKVKLKAVNGVYAASGMLTTAAAEYGIIGNGYIRLDAELPAGTGVSVETSVSNDLAAWSDWETPAADGEISAQGESYIRFRVTLSTTDTSVTPVLNAIELSTPGESAFKKLVIQAKSRWR